MQKEKVLTGIVIVLSLVIASVAVISGLAQQALPQLGDAQAIMSADFGGGTDMDLGAFNPSDGRKRFAPYAIGYAKTLDGTIIPDSCISKTRVLEHYNADDGSIVGTMYECRMSSCRSQTDYVEQEQRALTMGACVPTAPFTATTIGTS